jgi:hypothetical protein
MKIEKKDLFEFSELLVLISIFLLAGAFGLFIISFGLVGQIKSLSLETIPASMSLDTYKFSIGLTFLTFLPFIVFLGMLAGFSVLLLFSDRLKAPIKLKAPAENNNEMISHNIKFFILTTLGAAVLLFLTIIFIDLGNVYINILLKKFI